MKKILQKTIVLCLMMLSAFTASAQRFLSEIFPSATVTQNIVYANNFSVITGTPVAGDLFLDFYEPGGMPDPLLQRPLIIFMHTGSFLPTFINQQPTGNRRDSTVVEMCTRFAKRGYAVAAMSYRLGWNPAAVGGGANEDIRRGTLLSAVYRSIQDAKACVRFFRKDAATTNTYKIDVNNIILGGVGSGGYTAMAYATLEDPLEITLPKFLANFTIPAYGFTAGQPYVNQALLGDYDGYGGNAALNNPNNSVGYSNEVHFVFNMGGALGDSIWLEAGDAPMVAFHVVGDPFAPYGYGPVIVPTTGDYVVHVSGSSEIIRLATDSGNNNCFNGAGFTDPFTLHANTVNNGYDGLYPFYTNPMVQSGPWEWFDSLATMAGCALTGQTPTQCAAIYSNALLTNPDMSKVKAIAYIDTIMGYLNPRIVYCRNLPVAMNENFAEMTGVEIYPNPATSFINITSADSKNKILRVSITDIAGNITKKTENINDRFFRIERRDLSPGIYFVKVRCEKGELVRKITIQ
ncbi:MAG: T9SS type A sorting domain-containing protein [Bacteroidia bacterium]